MPNCERCAELEAALEKIIVPDGWNLSQNGSPYSAEDMSMARTTLSGSPSSLDAIRAEDKRRIAVLEAVLKLTHEEAIAFLDGELGNEWGDDNAMLYDLLHSWKSTSTLDKLLSAARAEGRKAGLEEAASRLHRAAPEAPSWAVEQCCEALRSMAREVK